MRRLILLLAAATAISAAELYRVAGVLVDSETGAPVANASVAFSPTAEPRSDMVAVTGPDGRFGFDAPRGVFRLSAVVAGSSRSFGEMSPFADMGCAVITGPDRNTAHLVFRWRRPAVIAGRVVDDQGESVEFASVRLFYSGVVEGHARITPLNYEATTNDQGEYRIWDVPGAAYFVVVTARPWYARSGQANPGQPQLPPSYATAYYPGTTDATRAAPLTVQPGEEAHADFVLTAFAGATLTVNCDNDTAQPFPLHSPRVMTLNVIAPGIGGTETFVSQPTFMQCPFTVNGILPGHYLLRMSDGETANPRAAQRWVDVGSGDMAVSLSLHPAAEVSGKVMFKDPVARPARLLVRLFRERDYESEDVPIAEDGSFAFSHVEPGKHLLLVSGAGYYAETIRVGKVPLPGAVLNIEDGVETRLSIVASNESGRFKGFATRDDQPVANMLVVLVPRDPASAYFIQGYQTDSDGSFDFPDLNAEDYLLFAVEDPTIAYADPETVKPYLPQAKSIRIEPGKVLDERVPVQPVVK
jgi:hypothetical protein